MNPQELKAYQRGYQLGMLNERRKWRGMRQKEKLESYSDQEGMFSRVVGFIRSGLQI